MALPTLTPRTQQAQTALNQQMPGVPPAPQMNAAGMVDPNAAPAPAQTMGNPEGSAFPTQAAFAASQFTGAGADPQNQAMLAMSRDQAERRAQQMGSQQSFDADLQRRIDEFYAEAERSLNPQWETRAREFEQSLIGRGIDPNSEAGQRARADFDRSRNDAFNSARNQATQFGAGLQQQRWQQQFAQDQADTQSMMANAMQGANLANMNFERDWRQRQFDEDRRRYDQGFGEDTRRYNQGFDFNMGRADMSDLMALMGFDRDTAGFNNAVSGQELSSILPFLNLIPNGGPTGIDVLNPYQMQQQQYQYQQGQRQQQQNAQGQMLGTALQMLPFIFSDERVKEEIRQVGVLHNGLPVYAYRYKHGGPTHIGVMAQDVEKVKPEAVIEVGGVKMVNYDAAVA